MDEVHVTDPMILEDPNLNKDLQHKSTFSSLSQTNASNHTQTQEKAEHPVKSLEMTGLLEDVQESQYPFFTEKAFIDMTLGRIPDFEPLYRSLSGLQVAAGVPVSAIQFLPALRAFSLTDPSEIENFLSHPETNHVLVQNDQIKIVLIRWEPGSECNIHGHAERGCVFKVLQGSIVEKRYSTDDEQRLLAEGTYLKDNIAYIDDIMGLHKVGNPSDTPAITLHMYTPGNYKPAKK